MADSPDEWPLAYPCVASSVHNQSTSQYKNFISSLKTSAFPSGMQFEIFSIRGTNNENELMFMLQNDRENNHSV